KLRDHFAALALVTETKWRLHQGADLVLEEAGRILKRRVELLHRLAVPAAEGRLIVPGVNLAGTAVDKYPNDAFGLRSEVRRPRGHGIQGEIGPAFVRPRPGSDRLLARDQCGQPQEPAPATGLCKPLAAREGTLHTCAWISRNRMQRHRYSSLDQSRDIDRFIR